MHELVWPRLTDCFDLAVPMYNIVKGTSVFVSILDSALYPQCCTKIRKEVRSEIAKVALVEKKRPIL
ncbi:MAG: hypothetical protein ACHQ1H_01890 [Nitrososphaerales archaeon]